MAGASSPLIHMIFHRLQGLKSFKKQTITTIEQLLITYPNLDKFVCHF